MTNPADVTATAAATFRVSSPANTRAPLLWLTPTCTVPPSDAFPARLRLNRRL
jgi:hypothetical protein